MTRLFFLKVLPPMIVSALRYRTDADNVVSLMVSCQIALSLGQESFR